MANEALLHPMTDWNADDSEKILWEDSYFDRPVDLFPGMSICISNKEDPITIETADGYLHIRMKSETGEKDWALLFKFSPDIDWDKREFSVLDVRRFSKLIAEEVVDSVQDPTAQLMRVWFLEPERFGLDFNSVMRGGGGGRVMRSVWGPSDDARKSTAIETRE